MYGTTLMLCWRQIMSIDNKNHEKNSGIVLSRKIHGGLNA
jgi:hypothetical protein